MKLARTSAAALALALAALLTLGSPARAGDPAAPSGPIVVYVRGHAALPADKLEIEFTVTASSEEPGEAERLYEERLAKVIAAAKGAPGDSTKPKKAAADDKAAPKKAAAGDDDDDDSPAPAKKKGGKKDKDEDKSDKTDKPAEAAKDAPDAAPIAVEVTERGLVVSARGGKGEENPLQKMMAMQMGGAQAKTDPPIRFASKVVTTIHDVSKLERKALLKRVSQLLDKVCEAGAEGADTAGSPVIHFLALPASVEGARANAYEDAVNKAKARSKSLAALVDRKVLRVASVREVSAPTTDAAKDPQAAAANVMVQMYGIKTDTPSGPSTFELSADVDLEVAFELAP